MNGASFMQGRSRVRFWQVFSCGPWAVPRRPRSFLAAISVILLISTTFGQVVALSGSASAAALPGENMTKDSQSSGLEVPHRGSVSAALVAANGAFRQAGGSLKQAVMNRIWPEIRRWGEVAVAKAIAKAPYVYSNHYLKKQKELWR